MSSSLWQKCLEELEKEYDAKSCNTWLRPLQADESQTALVLFAPNRFVLDWVQRNFFARIIELTKEIGGESHPSVSLEIGSRHSAEISPPPQKIELEAQPASQAAQAVSVQSTHHQQVLETVSSGAHSVGHPVLEAVGGEHATADNEIVTVTKTTAVPAHVQVDNNQTNTSKRSNLNPTFLFNNFVQGNSNQLARAASEQVAENPGSAYNPLFIYGGVGLGKTHLMHAVGNQILLKNPKARVLYLHSERFVADMVKALQTNAITEFKRFYRSLDVLLIDDIQFFAGKDRSQEEFFHTFNALLEGQQQIILTSDRYPKEIDGVEERLKSRFGWGLTVAVEPPELETRVAILMTKAEQSNIELPPEVAFFIGKRIRSNVRELEGALRRVIANAQFTGKPITIDFAQEALRDLLALHDKLVTIENITKTVSEYYKIKIADILSKRRSRSVARPRQMAMALAKELTNHSLPEIGDAFGGRDHTTVIHACRKIKELLQEDSGVAEDYKNLMRTLGT